MKVTFAQLRTILTIGDQYDGLVVPGVHHVDYRINREYELFAYDPEQDTRFSVTSVIKCQDAEGFEITLEGEADQLCSVRGQWGEREETKIEVEIFKRVDSL